MKRNPNIAQKAFEYHQRGFHCAEAVLKAAVDFYAVDLDDRVVRLATAFGGGVGKTHHELCGALSGGIIALGLLYGRHEPGADWTQAHQTAAELNHRFVQTYGTTTCGALLAGFGPQKEMQRCKRLSGEVAGMLGEIIEGAEKE